MFNLFVGIEYMERGYVNQADDYSCGPIAIYNALIALGYPPKSARWIRKECDPDPDYGTLYANFHRTLLSYLPRNIKCEYSVQPSYAQVRDHVVAGGVAIICEHWDKTKDNDSGEHYYVIFGMEGKKFLAANRSDHCKKEHQSKTHKNVELISWWHLRKSLAKHQLTEYPPNCAPETTENDLFYPTVWLLSKNITTKRKRSEDFGPKSAAKRPARAAESSCCIM